MSMPVRVFLRFFWVSAVAFAAILRLSGESFAASSLGSVSVGLTTTATNVQRGIPYTLACHFSKISTGLPPPTGTVSLEQLRAGVGTLLAGPFAPTALRPLTTNTAADPFYEGTLTYVCVYSGDANWAAATSALVNVTVSTADTVRSADLGAVDVGSSTVTKIALHFSRDTVLGSVNVVTQGLTGYDFQQESPDGGTCVVGSSYATGDQCDVNVTFTPKGIGQRLGAVLLYDESHVPIETKFLSGVGLGGVLHTTRQLSQVLYDPSITYYPPQAVTADAAGNLYIATTFDLFKLAPGSSTPTKVATLPLAGDVSFPPDLFFDGAGNLYYDLPEIGLLYTLPASGGPPVRIDVSQPHEQLGQKIGATVDGSGDLLVGDSSHDRIVTIPYEGVAPATASDSIESSKLALSATGDLFVIQPGLGTEAVYEKHAGDSAFVRLDTNLNVALSGVASIAVDAADTVYVSDQDRVVFLYANGTVGEVDVTTPPASFRAQDSPGGIAVDGFERLFMAQPSAIANGSQALFGTVSVYQSVIPALLDFGSATVGGSPATTSLQLTNTGNAPLQLSPVVTPSQYKIVSGCAPSIPANTSCTLHLSFTPAAGSASPGTTVPGTLTLNPDHSPVVVAPISLTATAVSAAP